MVKRVKGNTGMSGWGRRRRMWRKMRRMMGRRLRRKGRKAMPWKENVEARKGNKKQIESRRADGKGNQRNGRECKMKAHS